ncbi:D-alanyl-D-alanine carboxypeptidase family protein [Candidatus Neptunochlamydia vexilliferae]|uniref:D-alanyl-D-alanine carboxypeptidase DacF n=1 Tax=Candidatus Neptunichlamydia vexilliferae TaxID=1651774 RepID=A0ABS0AXM7_9BACT|nr:D-alanyl-D-alanine carboxypeptidase family protein [Candidatus Neptunochlamydia vexilliferae]MBF5058895.1 D-alanyl-D-alanine carboxypeptidase DacF [Candidatus Neptunochlamydia vexilliferae]
MRAIFLLVFSFLGCVLFAQPLKVTVSAKSALLVNAETGAILYDKKGGDRIYPASLTKIATCLYALRENKKGLDHIVKCSRHGLRRMSKSVKMAHNYRDPAYYLEPDGSHFWIKRGEELSFQDLLYGMMLASGNDAANFVAISTSGSIPKFMKGLNRYLKEMGCEDTHFANPHGLHHPNHWSTAHDIALIVKEAMKNELFRTIVSTREYERSRTNLQKPKMIKSRDLLIHPGKFSYPRAHGMKTGGHSDAGYTYASVAKEGDRMLIAILLGCPDIHSRFRDAIRLFDAAFEEEKEERLLFKKEDNTFSREIARGKTPIKATLSQDITISYYPAEEPQVTIELNWKHLTPPIQKGSHVGEMNILDEQGRVLESSPLIATAKTERTFSALMGDTIRGKEAPPIGLQRTLIFLLACAVLLILFGLWRVQTTSQKNP